MSVEEDIRLLLVKYVDGALSSDEDSEVEDRLKRDASVRKLLMEIAVDEVLVRNVFQEGAGRGVKKARREIRQRRSIQRSGVRWGMWLAIAACLAIVVGSFVYNARQQDRFVEVLVAHIEQTSPDVTVIRGADGRAVSATVGMDLFVGDCIETKKGEKAVFVYPNEETNITVGSGTRESALVIGTTAKGRRLRLEKGMIDASVAPQPADKAFVVATPHAKAKIVGTVFSLCVDRSATWLDVREGSVELARFDDGKAITVGVALLAVAGEQAEDFALTTYPTGAEWVDGPILRQDDFEKGMGNWQAVLMTDVTGEAKGLEALKQEMASRVKRIEVERSVPLGKKKRTGVVSVQTMMLNKKMLKIGIRLKKAIEADSYSVQWDRCIKPPGFARSGGTTDTWSRMRNEVVIAKDSNGTETMWQTVWVDGKRFGMKEISEPDTMAGLRACYLSGLPPFPGSETWLDNIVVRRLVRVAAWRQ